MDRVAEMLGLKEIRDPAVGEVVAEDGAQQSLFGLNVDRRPADRRLSFRPERRDAHFNAASI
jgi:hypothetical protein